MNLKEKVEDIFDITAQPAVDILSSMFFEGIVGSVVPGVASVILAYKQKRSEKMIVEFMIETKKRQQVLEDKLIQLEEERFVEIKGKYFGLVLDYVMENKQEEKIEYLVNGFINLVSMEELQEDVVLIYYDILNSLNLLDIRVLKIYDFSTRTEDYYDVLDDVGISHDQYTLIQNKLEQLGLLETKGQLQYEVLFENVKNIGEYLTNVERGKKVRLKYKKPNAGNIKSYNLTKLGLEFLKFFVEG